MKFSLLLLPQNRFFFFISLFSFAITFLIVWSVNDASAIGRLNTCTRDSTNGSGLDGSDCDAGLVCDKYTKLCAYPTEVPCNASSAACPIGMACLDDDGTILSTSDSNAYGTCQPYAGNSAEDNAISDVLCNVYKFATGKTGRIVIGIVLIAAGGTFLLGKMQFGTLMAMVIGAGFVFGGPAIVGVLVGKGFAC